MVYDLRVQYGLDKTIADLVIVSPFVFGAGVITIGLIMMAAFLGGWDPMATIESYKYLWVYLELPIQALLVLLFLSGLGIMVYRYRF